MLCVFSFHMLEKNAFELPWVQEIPALASTSTSQGLCHYHRMTVSCPCATSTFTIDLQELAREPYCIVIFVWHIVTSHWLPVTFGTHGKVWLCAWQNNQNTCCFGPKKFVLMWELQQNISDLVEYCKLSGTQVKLSPELSINSSSRIIHISMHRFGQKFFLIVPLSRSLFCAQSLRPIDGTTMIGFKWGVDRNALGMADTGDARLRVIDLKVGQRDVDPNWGLTKSFQTWKLLDSRILLVHDFEHTQGTMLQIL